MKMSVLPTRAAPLIDRAFAALSGLRIEWRFSGRVALGVLLVAIAGEPARHREAVVELKRLVSELGGTATVHSRVPGVFAQALQGDVDRSSALSRRVAAQFDPHGMFGGRTDA